MLGKLMKYEIKSCGRIFFPFYIVALLFSILGTIFINFDNYEHDFSIVYIVGLFTAFALFVAAIVLTIILIVQRFNKSLLEDEGYLMFTLPVSKKTLVMSKFLTALLFITLTAIVSTICILLFSIMFGYKISDIIDIGTVLNGVVSFVLENIFNMLFYFLSSLLNYSIFILTIYLALTICHLPKLSKHKVLSGLGAMILLLIIQSIIGEVINICIDNTKIYDISSIYFSDDVYDYDSLGSYFYSLFKVIFSVGTYEITVFVTDLAIAVALFFGTTTLLEKKLNLD